MLWDGVRAGGGYRAAVSVLVSNIKLRKGEWGCCEDPTKARGQGCSMLLALCLLWSCTQAGTHGSGQRLRGCFEHTAFKKGHLCPGFVCLPQCHAGPCLDGLEDAWIPGAGLQGHSSPGCSRVGALQSLSSLCWGLCP